MKVIKPLQVSYFPHVQRFAGDWFQLHTAIVAWDLVTGDTRTEIDFWRAAEPLNKKQIPVDEFIPKPENEFLAAGSFFAPLGRAVRAGFAEIEVGSIRKRLSVFGERRWKSAAGITTTFTDPAPFVTLPLDWENAYGGLDYEQNPLGIGRQEDPETGDLILPRIETFGEEMGDPKNEPPSGSFLPISVTHPDRAICRGSYDGRYLEKFFPGYPDDLETRFFNRTPENQWISDELNQSCPFVIRNMHPKKEEISGVLPDFDIRVFQVPKDKVDGQFDEVLMRADTVWFFPDAELGALIFHGSNPTEFHDWEHIESITVGYERKSQQRKTVSHYQKATQTRMGDQMKELGLMVNGADLIPLGERTLMAIFEESPDDTLKMYAVERAEEGTKKKALEYIDDEEKQLLSREKRLADMPEDASKEMQKQIDEMRKMLSAQRKRIEGDKLEGLSPEEQRMLQAVEKVTPRKADGSLDLQKFEFSAVEDAFEAADDVLPPSPPSRQQFTQETLKQIDDHFESGIKKLKETPNPKDYKELRDSLSEKQLAVVDDMTAKIEKDARQQYQKVRSALEDDSERVPLPRPPAVTGLLEAIAALDIEGMLKKHEEIALDYIRKQGDAPDGFAEKVSVGLSEIETISNEDLKEFIDQIQRQIPDAEEADEIWHLGYVAGCHEFPDGSAPHGLEASELRLLLTSRLAKEVKRPRIDDFAELELADHTLNSLDLSKAYFEQANLRGVDWLNCNLSGVVLARSSLVNVNFFDCNFDNASFGGAVLTNCTFNRCSFNQTNLSKGKFGDCRFQRCDFQENIVSGASFLATTFEDCDFTGAIFLESKFIDAVISCSSLTRVFLSKCHVDDISIQQSDLKQCVIAEGNFSNPSLISCSVERIFFGQELQIRRALFENCKFNMANFRELDLTDSVFRNVFATLSDFSDAKITNVVWIDNQFLDCRFLKTDITGAVVNQCDFSNSNMQEADLRDGKFSDSSFFSVQFLHAKIGGAHFSECDLNRTLLEDWSP